MFQCQYWFNLSKLLLLLLVASAQSILAAQAPRPTPDALEKDFLTPPDAAKPWAYWWWVNGNVDEKSITRDLEAMKRQGFAGLLMFDARGYHDEHLPPPPPRMEFMGPEWRRLLHYALVEADRLGLKVSVNLSSCGGALRGPWDVGEDAPKQLVWAEQPVAGGKRFEGAVPRGKWSGRSWGIALLAVRFDGSGTGDATTGKPRKAAEVIDLTDKVIDGRLAWNAPQGNWTLLRFAWTLMAGHERDVDILDPDAVARHFDRMGRPLLADAGPLAGKTLTHFYSVSWEGAAPTWTRNFENDFQHYRGYPIRSWLPALAGLTVKSPEQTARFMRDYHRTLGDCFMDHCYGTLRNLCHQAGLQWHSESGGPWDRKLPDFQHADQLAFLGRNDMPQGEFWRPWRGFTRPVANAAHIYGLPLAAAEAFTNMQPHWSESPAMLKPLADAAFCDGINHLIWHTFTASPPEFGKPGIEYFAGSHLNPNVTWFEQSGPFLKYLARCQFMLRQGSAAADICVYTGDSPYQHWDPGQKWSPKPTLTLSKGYSYDLLNTEVLRDRLEFVDGRLSMPDGMTYKMLVVDLDDETIPLWTLCKIDELTRAGATVVLGRRQPQKNLGPGSAFSDNEVTSLTMALWGPKGARPGTQSLGQGKLLRGMTMDAALEAQKILPDVEAPWAWTHRQGEGLDIYFLKGAGAAECTFRIHGRQPELWDPVTGRICDAAGFRETSDGRTVVPLDLPENGSTFVVFRRPAEKHPSGAEPVPGNTRAENAPAPLALAGPWEVRFTPGWGAPESAVFENLIPWNEHPDVGIKYFSGTATYHKTFELTEAQAHGPVSLELGVVKHIATVKVNGQSLGTVWTAPWQLDLTGKVKPGNNTLEVAVTNFWVNRLIGDATLPEEKRLTKTHARRPPGITGQHAHLKGYKADDPLDPSGLLGPVRFVFGTPQANHSLN